VYFVFYLCIQPGVAHNANSRFTIYFVCCVSHTQLVQTFLLKQRKAAE